MSTRKLKAHRLWPAEVNIQFAAHEMENILIDVGTQIWSLDRTTLETIKSIPNAGVYGFYHVGNQAIARYVYDQNSNQFQLCLQYGTAQLPKVIAVEDIAIDMDQSIVTYMMNHSSPYALIKDGIIVYADDQVWTFTKNQAVITRELCMSELGSPEPQFLIFKVRCKPYTYKLRFHGNTYALYQSTRNIVAYGRKNNAKTGHIVINSRYEVIDIAVSSHEVICIFFTDMITGYLLYAIWEISQKALIDTFRIYSVAMLKLRADTPNLRIIAIANICYVISDTGIASYAISTNQASLPRDWHQ